MIESKKFFSDFELEELARRFKALSEPSRLKILRVLFDNEKNVGEIAQETGLLQANVSKQLKILVAQGVVQCRPFGLMRFYKVCDPTIHSICSLVCRASNNKNNNLNEFD
jgi:DNA-binding transcriptional ArsR family regulator